MGQNSAKKNKISFGVILAIVWLIANCFIGYQLFSSKIEFRTNIVSLLSRSDNSSSSSISLGTSVLDSNSRKIRFLIQSENRDSIKKVSDELSSRLSKVGQALPLALPDQDSVLQSILPYLSNSSPLLLSKEQIELFKLGPDAVTRSIQEKLYSPLASFYSRFIDKDPLLLLADRFLELETSNQGELVDGLLVKETYSKNKGLAYSTVLFAEISSTELTPKDQGALIESINNIVSQLDANNLDVEITWSGIIRFAHSSASRLEKDLKSLSSFGSLIGIGIVLLAFASAYVVILCSIAVLIGITSGVFLVCSLTGGIHLITLGVGISLMGACVDYSIHYLSEVYFSKTSETPAQARAHVIKPIFLGALTSAVAFLALSLSSFPGLQELSLFALGSITSSVITVLLWHPMLVRNQKKTTPKLLTSFQGLVGKLRKVPLSNPKTSLLLLGIFVTTGLSQLRVNDDIHALQAAKPELVENELKINEFSPTKNPSSYVIAMADSKSLVIDQLHLAHQLLLDLKAQDAIGSFSSIYGLIPPTGRQKENHKLWIDFLNQHVDKLRDQLIDLGYRREVIDETLKHKEFEALEFDELLNLLPISIKGAIEAKRHGTNKYYGVIPVYDEKNPTAARKIFAQNSNLTFFSPRTDISRQFRSYRLESSYLVLVAYALIIFFLFARYGVKLSLRALIPLLCGAALTFSCLGFLGQAVSFFSILAILIVLGLSIDFSIFLLEAKNDNDIVQLAVILSACSTIACFGLLALSSTAVLASIGSTVGIGVFFCLLLSLVLIPQTGENV